MGAQTATPATRPRIYVACLAAYNRGILHGAWIDAVREPWSLWGEIRDVLAVSPVAGAEEWAIHDHEGFEGLRVGEHEGLAAVSELAMFIDEHGAVGAALLNHFGGDLAEAREAMAERYLGTHASLADYLQELTEETTTIPPALRLYVDWEAMARDTELSGDLFTVATAWNVVHVFAGC